MGALFMLIIVGLFWGGKSIFDICGSCKELNMETVQSKISIYPWDAKKFLTRKNIKLVEDDLKEIFDDEWDNAKKLICLSGNDYGMTMGQGFHNVTNLVNEVIVAKHGFVESRRQSYTLNSILYDFVNCRGKHRAINFRACKVIERYMQEAHPDLNLCLIHHKVGDEICMSWNHYYQWLHR